MDDKRTHDQDKNTAVFYRNESKRDKPTVVKKWHNVLLNIENAEGEAYQKAYEDIDIFLKQFPHLRHVVVGELKTKSGKNLFRKLNEHSKELQAKQEEIAKKYNALSVKYEELKHLKVNMNEYLGRDKREKKESVIEKISRHKEQDKKISKEKKEKMKEVER